MAHIFVYHKRTLKIKANNDIDKKDTPGGVRVFL